MLSSPVSMLTSCATQLRIVPLSMSYDDRSYVSAMYAVNKPVLLGEIRNCPIFL